MMQPMSIATALSTLSDCDEAVSRATSMRTLHSMCGNSHISKSHSCWMQSCARCIISIDNSRVS